MILRSCLAFLLAATLSAFAQEAAQPPLPTATLTAGSRTIKAEVADDDTERSAGLMFREQLEPDAGMVFIMPTIGPAGFWMKNTRIPLSIAFLDPQGTILEIHDMEPQSEKVVRSVFPKIAYALEMEKGWFAKNGILPGVRVSGLPAPSRQQQGY